MKNKTTYNYLHMQVCRYILYIHDGSLVDFDLFAFIVI